MGNSQDQFFLRCSNCGAVFSASIRLPPASFESAGIQNTTYQCPDCSKFDTYGKTDLFYDDGNEHVLDG